MPDNSLETKSVGRWQGRTDGTPWMHSALQHLLRIAPLRAVYLFADIFVVPFYLLFSKSNVPIYRYFRHRQNYSPVKSFFSAYRNFCQFSKNILDKFKMYSGGSFDFETDNMHLYDNLARKKDGFLIFSAHVGNFELAGYTLTAVDKPFNAMLFGGEGDVIMRNRSRILAEHNIRLIPSSDDMSHLIALNNAVTDGESVSIPADRTLPGQKKMTVRFLGADAEFPAGPFTFAAKRDLAVLSVQVMKDSAKKYKIFIKQLDMQGETVAEKSECLLKSFTSHLEDVLEIYPLQWFNFYEFWQK